MEGLLGGRLRRVDPRHRVALPRDVMSRLGVGAGAYVLFELCDDDGVRLHRVDLAVRPRPPGGRPG